MSLQKLLFVTILIAIGSSVLAQRNYEQYNLLGLQGGVALFDIDTQNFKTQQGTGFAVGFVTRGDVYNNFDLEYGITFFQNEVGILGRDFSQPTNNFDERYIDFVLQSAQVKFLAGYNIIRHHLSIDAGPILNVNGKLKPKNTAYENHILDGYDTLKASDIDNVSRIHFHLAAGVTAGFEHLRVNAQYQFGLTNLFNRFNDSEELAAYKPEGGFEGKTSTILLGAYLYF